MNICYFSNQFASASGHGIAHYAHRLFDGLRAHSDVNVIPTATWSDRSSERFQSLEKRTGLKLLPWGRKLTPLAWTYMNAPPIERWMDVPVDITHMVAPGFPVATRKKLVVTVHDMGPISHPEFFTDSKPTLFKRAIAQTIRQADAIIGVSEATADEFIGYAGEHVRDRVHVIHEGVDFDFFSQKPKSEVRRLRSDIGTLTADLCPPTSVLRDAPFFLAAGAMSPRKNILRVLEAFSKVMAKVPHHLVLVGGGGWDSKAVFDRLGHPELAGRVHHLGYVSDEELRSLYRGAEFYIHPSLFEGFGLTVLEAMAAGCPVITSNTTSLPEVAGEAALLLDPTSEDAIAEAIETFAGQKALRQGFAARGLERVKKFQWSEAARQVVEVYRSV